MKYKKILINIFCLVIFNNASAQVAIGTTILNPSAALEVKSNSKGVLLPRLTQNNILAISNPAVGLTVYCTDCQNKGLQVFDGVSWKSMSQCTNGPRPIVNEVILDFSSTLVGSKLTTYYNYNKNAAANENINAVVYKWYRANDAMGTGVELILGATNKFYTITNLDINKWIAVEVRAFSMNGEVSESALSTYIPAQFVFNNQTYSAVRGIYDGPDANTIGDYVWIDRNLGASQVAASATDNNSYGNYFQWGRPNDGHQLTTSSTTTVLATTTTPSNNKFIQSSTPEWTTTRQDNLWTSPSFNNQVCPAGFKVPAATMFENERIALGITNNATVFNNRLKLTNAGYRSNTNGQFTGVGVNAYYWTTTISSGSPYGVNPIKFDATGGGFVSSSFLSKASGLCVRCILK